MKRHILTMHDGQQLFWEGNSEEILSSTATNVFEYRFESIEGVFLSTPTGQLINFRYVVRIDEDPTA